MDSKTSEDFRNWLISSHHLQKRSAGDVVSRRNKLLRIIGDPSTLSKSQLKARLEEEWIKGEFTRTTLIGMIRAENLYQKFKEIKNLPKVI